MRIAILSPINPLELSEYLFEPDKVEPIECAASSVHSLIKGFVDDGHEITVITTTAGKNECLKEYLGDRLHIFVIENQFKRGWFGLRLINRIRKLVYEHIDEFDVLHAQWTYIYAFSILPFVKILPCICSVRDWCPYQMKLQRTVYGKMSWGVKYYYFKKVMNETRLVKVSNSIYTERKISSWNHKSILIPNPINKTIILPFRKQSVDLPVFISVASNLLDPRKNISNLLFAFQKFNNKYKESKLYLIGKGCQDDFINQFKDTDFFQSVIFCGSQTHSEVIRLIDQASVLIHPSIEETFGNIFLEAAARCIPSIGGYNSGAVPQVLDFGRAGCLCDVDDSDSLFNAMDFLINNKAYYNLIVQNASSRIIKNYSSDIVCKKHINLYKQIQSNFE